MSMRFPATIAALALALSACDSPETEPEPADLPPPEAQTDAPAAESAGGQSAAAQPAGAESGAEAGADAGTPERIVAERGGFIPEGIEYDPADERILTGSLSEGTIFEIGTDGSVTPFIEDPELQSSVGIEVDEARDRLLVVNSDSSVFQGGGPGQAMLGAFVLSTGERLAMVDLATVLEDPGEDAEYFANDVAVGDDGTAYVTDSRANVVYQVSTDYEPSVLHRFDLGEDAGLNGIEYHEDGYLIVVGGPDLYKLPLDDPQGASRVDLAEPIQGMDGIVWTEDGRLAVVSNAESRVVALTSDDDWASAQVDGTATFEGQATTAAAAGGDLYVVQPHFADQDPPTILRVTL